MRDDDQLLTNSGSAPGRGRTDELHVVARAARWHLRLPDCDDAGPSYGTKAEAVTAARTYARAKGARILVHEEDGAVWDELILGRSAFEQLSAVEGIHLTEAMREDLLALDDTGLSGDERRRVLVEKYGKTRRS